VAFYPVEDAKIDMCSWLDGLKIEKISIKTLNLWSNEPFKINELNELKIPFFLHSKTVFFSYSATLLQPACNYLGWCMEISHSKSSNAF
jgi:hypothetical protein